MRVLRGKRWIVLAAFVVGGAVGAGIASAVTTTTTVADTNTVRERIATVTTDGGFSSGWHIHPGPVILQVQDGYLKITQATCHPNVVGPGETYIEAPRSSRPRRGKQGGNVHSHRDLAEQCPRRS
jgi:hypothetical protein